MCRRITQLISALSKMILSDDRDKFIKVVQSWTTKLEVPGEADSVSGGFLGLIHYSSSSNHVVRLDFFIQNGFKVNRAIMRLKTFDQLWTGGTTLRINNIKGYLNPGKTKVSLSGSDAFRYSGGTEILPLYSPSSDEAEIEVVFTNEMANNILPGHNVIIIQQETQDLADAYIGRGVVNLTIKGYLPWQTR